MSHRLGSIRPGAPQISFGPSSGNPPTSPDRWDATHEVDPLAKFVMLHFNGSLMGPGDRIEINLGYGTDVYTPAWGPDFWTRPIRGNVPVAISYIAAAGSTGRATMLEYGRGEAARGGGTSAAGSVNTNADVFMIDGPYQEPPYFPPSSVTFGHTAPSWVPVDSVTVPPIPHVAERVGMFVIVNTHVENVLPEDGSPPRNLSSCTATLIAPDLIITAAHCASTDEEVRTGSFTLDYRTGPDGTTVPPGYDPKWFKIVRVVRSGYARAPGDTRLGLDYTIMQIDAAPPAVPATPVEMRTTPVPNNEPLFIIHHRRGTPKKVSRYPTDNGCRASDFGQDLGWQASLDHGSSGSSVFDSEGRIVAIVRSFSYGPKILAILDDLKLEPPAPRDTDVVLVLDRSGSMSLPGLTGATKMVEAKEAASLFVSLLRTDRTHRAGLVSFSTTATDDRGLDAIADARGPLMGSGGSIPSLAAGGNTSIGHGLERATAQFPPVSPAANSRAILVMTDGLENTSPLIAAAEAGLTNSRVNVVGFGTDANLDAVKMTGLAVRHNGIYMRANDGLALKKFFALGFGNIFDYGTSFDPDFVIEAEVPESAPVIVNVCGESQLTVVCGWDRMDAQLRLRVLAPDGATTIVRTTPGVIGESGATWAHLRFALPFLGHQDGAWRVQAVRPADGSGEFPPPAPRLRYFLTTFADGGPFMQPDMPQHFYTGDPVTPRVVLRYPNGRQVHGATVKLVVTVPNAGTGNLLQGNPLAAPMTVAGDVIDARASTLIAMEQAHGSELVTTSTQEVTLHDDGEHDDGAMEPDGIFGTVLADLTQVEGNYTFHARATYGDDCVASRETSWSVYVAVGIDPSQTTMTSENLGGGRIRITFTPRDRYGNYAGPGRGDSFTVQPSPGSTPDGALVDNGDGTYTQVIVYDASSGHAPGLSIVQPGRPAAMVGGGASTTKGCATFWLLIAIALFVLIVLVILLST